MRNSISPLIVEDTNRNLYLEALKEYREKGNTNRLIELFEIEQKNYYEKCQYFI
jgi:hypothetical protein